MDCVIWIPLMPASELSPGYLRPLIECVVIGISSHITKVKLTKCHVIVNYFSSKERNSITVLLLIAYILIIPVNKPGAALLQGAAYTHSMYARA